MRTEEYIRAKYDELKSLERAAEAKGLKLGEALTAKRDDVMTKLESLKSDAGERADVLRMGVESAWAELKTAFETLAKKDLHAKP